MTSHGDRRARNPVEALMEAHERLKLLPIAMMPGKLWRGSFGPWSFVVNANRKAMQLESGVMVGSFQTYVEYNGWPAGSLDLLGGGQFAAGSGANPATFVAAVEEWNGR